MKFSCNTTDLLQALQLCSRAIGSQQALPILSNIHLQVEGKRCTLSATDLELSVITSIEASIEHEGVITIPAKALLNVAQYTNDIEILLETVEGTQLRCVTAKTKTTLSGESASEYPTIPPVEKKTSFTIHATPLLTALHLVTFASARSSMRPVLSGVSVRSHKNTFVLVATDSYRLSEYVIPAHGVTEEVSCIIPVKVLEELKMILGSQKMQGASKKSKEKGPSEADDVLVEVTLSQQQIELVVGETHLRSRLIDGKFPDYKQIIPQNTVCTVAVAASELTTAVKRMHYFAKEMNNNLTFHIQNGMVRISTPQTALGKDEATIQGDGSGEGKIALSSSYLLDFLGHTGSDTLEIAIVDSMHPAVFRLPADPALLHLIMPLRMQEE